MPDFSTTLSDSPFGALYHLPFCHSDSELIQTFSILFIGVILVVIVWNLLGNFQYGKAAESTNSDRIWNYPISARTTWRYDCASTLVIPVLLIMWTPCNKMWNVPNLSAAIAYYLHYFYRSILYASNIPDGARPTPAWFTLFLFVGHASNDFFQFHHLFNVFEGSSTFSSTIIWGIVLTALGGYINYHHDLILLRLRSKSANYQIPKGGLFSYVSCANYFGEIVKWWGYAIITWASPQIVFALFSMVFLGMRASFTHQYYQQRFSKYPAERKAVIPFIY